MGGTEPEPPRPLDGLAGTGVREYEGQWSVAWPHDRAGDPLTVHWRAYVPAACAR